MMASNRHQGREQPGRCICTRPVPGCRRDGGGLRDKQRAADRFVHPPAQVELTFDHRQGLGLSFKEGRGAPPVVELIQPGQAMNQNDKLVVQVQPGWVVTSVRGGDEGEEADTRSKTAGEMITKLKSFELPWTVRFAQ